MDAEKVAEGLFAATRRYVDAEIAKALAALKPAPVDLQDVAQRAAALLPKPKDGVDGAKGLDGAPGLDGKSITAEDVEPMVARLVAKALEAAPKPRDGTDGRDGRDGASVSVEAVATLVSAEVAKAVAALPKPADGKDGAPGKDGADGKDGAPGKDGERGADGINGKDGAPGRDGSNGRDGANGKDGADAVIDVDEVVVALKRDPEAVQMLRGERGLQGLQGEPGRPGDAGRDGVNGKDGQRGIDGTSVTIEQIGDVVRQRFDTWALEFEREAEARQRHAMGLVPLPRDGTNGRDGRDGFGLDDFEVELTTPDGGRTLVLEISAGGRTSTSTLRTATPLDRGPFDAAKRYQAGDGITFGGHWWIAQKDAPAGRPGESPDWRLAVRRGKDAKE
jgi:hypothetical protein